MPRLPEPVLLATNTMMVLLLADVRGVGKRNELKQVSDGYARNFLFPKGLARVADDAALAQHKAYEWTQEQELLKLKHRAHELAQIVFPFSVKVGAHNEVFGSVTKKDLEKALVEKGFSDARLDLDHAIKATGEQKVPVSFGKGVAGEMVLLIQAA